MLPKLTFTGTESGGRSSPCYDVLSTALKRPVTVLKLDRSRIGLHSRSDIDSANGAIGSSVKCTRLVDKAKDRYFCMCTHSPLAFPHCLYQ